MAGLAPDDTEKTAKDEKIRFEKEALGGATLFANRFLVQTYPEGGFRISFSEQFSSDMDVPPIFRTSVFMLPTSVAQFAQAIVNLLPPGTITVPPIPQIRSPLEDVSENVLSAYMAKKP